MFALRHKNIHFFNEPRLFGNDYFCNPLTDSVNHPEIVGSKVINGQYNLFCTSQEAGKRYLFESISQIFAAVPKLGGAINIMLGEDNGSCAAQEAGIVHPGCQQKCPICLKRDYADILKEEAEIYTQAIHKYNPNGEYIAWFYDPCPRHESEKMYRLLHVAEKWDVNSTFMLNFESGNLCEQLGKNRVIFDYSLANIGPAEFFKKATNLVSKMGAKLQVGCSHENASIPFMPVPKNLYEKYDFIHKNKISTVMQCWYFGNYPGIMNKAAGELSFEPFFNNSKDFLTHLAKPDWGIYASMVVKAWNYFSESYQNFPANIAFKWYGLLHSSIVWPLYLFPVDTPLAPSWVLNKFPLVNGDRIGEALCYHHTLSEALQLCIEMRKWWNKGVEILETLREKFIDNPLRTDDINLAKAINIQISSTCNVLEFYYLREDMFFNKNDHLKKLKDLVIKEIANSKEMKTLCECDSRIGYHSEAEGYLFFSEKLVGRINLLEELLTQDFPKFNLNAHEINEYTGINPQKPVAISGEKYKMTKGKFWSFSFDEKNLYFQFYGVNEENFSLVIEPCRLWSPLRIDFFANGEHFLHQLSFRTIPEYEITKKDNDLYLTLNRQVFEGFYRNGFNMRANIFGENFFWIDPKPWPNRLLHTNFNSKQAGWLIL